MFKGMKTTTLSLLAACFLGLCGCPRMPLAPSEAEVAANNPSASVANLCHIRVYAGTPLSKATAAPLSKVAAASVNETRIASLQVLVFRSDGLLENYASSTGSSLTLDCTVGQKTFWAFANIASLQNIKTLDELNAFAFSLNTATADALPMQGCVYATITNHGSLDIVVSRMVCKIVLNDVITRLGASWAGGSLQLSRIYLTNAVSGVLLDGSIQSWANKISYGGECPSLTLDTPPSAGAWDFAATDSLRLSRVFFALPNPTAEDNLSGSWSPRFTRLVLEGSLKNPDNSTALETAYYPIPIGNLLANHCYIIQKYTISRPGLDAPNADASLLETGFTITVKPWDETHVIQERL